MKNLFKLTYAYLILVQCTVVQRQDNFLDPKYELITARFYKIDEKINNNIYYFKSDSISGVFVQEKECTFQNKSWKKIKLNKNYKLLLNRYVISDLNRSSGFSVNINGEYDWDSEMKEVLFRNCSNVCGDKIYVMKY